MGLAFAWNISVTCVAASAPTDAEKFASGDLTHEFEVSCGDRVADMLRAISTMRDQLSTLAVDVRQNVESVATASVQISQGNAGLSSRTK